MGRDPPLRCAVRWWDKRVDEVMYTECREGRLVLGSVCVLKRGVAASLYMRGWVCRCLVQLRCVWCAVGASDEGRKWVLAGQLCLLEQLAKGGGPLFWVRSRGCTRSCV